MTRYLIDFSYSGANFSGYQKQPGKRTVQDEIEKVLSSINNNSVKLTSSGRTDALVNAIHQKAHFDLDKEIGAYKLNGALNSYLPDDIYVNSVTKVDNLFDKLYAEHTNVIHGGEPGSWYSMPGRSFVVGMELKF